MIHPHTISPGNEPRKLVGAEALVRWYHPEKGLISPGEFIPTFEKNNFILEMEQVIELNTQF